MTSASNIASTSLVQIFPTKTCITIPTDEPANEIMCVQNYQPPIESQSTSLGILEWSSGDPLLEVRDAQGLSWDPSSLHDGLNPAYENTAWLPYDPSPMYPCSGMNQPTAQPPISMTTLQGTTPTDSFPSAFAMSGHTLYSLDTSMSFRLETRGKSPESSHPFQYRQEKHQWNYGQLFEEWEL
jgi:hypothetical protein